MIEVRKLRKVYPGGFVAVNEIDFDVAAGEVFGLLGPNGAGKSTTIGMLTTTIVPTSGSARLAGFDVATPYLDEAERLCDRIAIIHAGEIIALDTPERLRAQLGQELVELRARGDAENALAALRSRGVAGDDAFTLGSTLTVPLHDITGSAAIAVVDELGLATEVGTRRPTLDDVYLRLTGARLAAAA